jgi:hypothetical protein
MRQLLLSLPRRHFRQMMAGDASADGAQNRMVSGIMAGDASRDGAAEAADGVGRGRQRANNCDGDECSFDFHGLYLFTEYASRNSIPLGDSLWLAGRDIASRDAHLLNGVMHSPHPIRHIRIAFFGLLFYMSDQSRILET